MRRFPSDKGGGKFGSHEYDFVLVDGKNNLFPPLLDENDVSIKKNTVIKYFAENNVAWWRGDEPTGHILSSQVACLNHLFYLRHDKDAVMQLLSSFSNDFVDVIEIETDKEPYGYIQFEAVSVGNNLNEGIPTRGTNCTSVDAFIYAKHKNDEKWIIPIEWKYTEEYNSEDKSSGKSGAIRLERYIALINKSQQVNPEYWQWFFYEPFYQLMRQTLWAEQIIQKKTDEKIKADNYMHLHIIPNENKDLLNRMYSCSKMNMEDTWRKCIVNQDKYKIISPQDFLKNVSGEKYNELKKYLSVRYWNEK
ncbi:MAG: hypothetical protein LBL45_07025 [Treponema sp.]|jgi:hypothetical protein|nr:hypothetical protein [Treponema sp.]